MTKENAADQAKRLAGVYERKKITANTLVSEIAGFARPEDVNAIMDALSPQIRAIFEEWVRSLHEENGHSVILWPLRPGLKAAFKKWLAEYESTGRRERERSA